jgi:CheY-like chemotaxis protein
MTAERFTGRRILVVEDEYLIAMELTEWLTAAGAQVVGPAGTVPQALNLIAKCGAQLDGATLDINVRGTMVFPAADALRAIDVPFIFCTGYDPQKIPQPHRDVRRCEKPVDADRLMEELARAIAEGHSSGAAHK